MNSITNSLGYVVYKSPYQCRRLIYELRYPRNAITCAVGHCKHGSMHILHLPYERIRKERYRTIQLCCCWKSVLLVYFKLK